MAATPTDTPGMELPEAATATGNERPRQKAVTIGAVCKALAQEFPDISISKIRYLEDQKLLSPRRTQGGYRLYTASDIQRLRTILRLQRDEFLPLRVIRQELAAGRAERDVAAPSEGDAGVSGSADRQCTLRSTANYALQQQGQLQRIRVRSSQACGEPVQVLGRP